MGVRLTERGRWVLVYLPAFLLLEAGLIIGAVLTFGPNIFKP